MNFLNAEWVDLILPPKEVLLKNLSQNIIWVSQNGSETRSLSCTLNWSLMN